MLKVSRRLFFYLLAAGGIGTVLFFATPLLQRERGGEIYCPEEPPLVYGREECPVCLMVVDYPPSSAAMRARIRGVERWYFFDDVGCLATWHKEVRQGGEVLEICVRDRLDGKWIRGDKAVYLITTEFTAMGTGIIPAAPGNVERYKKGEVVGPWRVRSVGGVEEYSPPKPAGEVRAVVDYKCVFERFSYGPAWSTPPDWYRGC